MRFHAIEKFPAESLRPEVGCSEAVGSKPMTICGAQMSSDLEGFGYVSLSLEKLIAVDTSF